jgi:uncharacterized membrane protein YvlD (DUF360 family)
MQRFIFNVRLIRRLLLRYALVWLGDTASITATALLLPGIYFVHDQPYWYLHPFRVALLLGLLNALVRPLLILLFLPITFATLGLATLVLNAGLFYLTHLLVDSFVIASFATALIGALVLTLVNTLLGNLVRLDDDHSFYAKMMDRFSVLTGPKPVEGAGRGLIILQIDGLSYGSLKRAIQRGKMPYVGALLRRRRVAIRKWFPGLPAQTSAVQAGIFYGDSFDIPGFHWYDKTLGRMVTSSNSADMKALDDRFAGRPSLLEGGTVINSLIHGGATKKILTVSAFSDKDLKHHRASLEDFAIFLLHPYLYARTFLLMIWDFVVDRFETTRDLVRGKKPKLTRSIKFSFLRAVVNAFFRESTTFFTIEDIIRGTPVIYTNYLGYDMVSHYAGPDSWDALSTLTGIDRQIRKIGRAIARKAPRHFDLVVLSDHGQTRSESFRSLYKMTLREAIEGHLSVPLSEPAGHTAALAYFNTLLREVRSVEEAYGERSIRGTRRSLERLEKTVRQTQTEVEAREPIVVCANGNLAHVYFTESPLRVTTEYVMLKHPTLLQYLVSHPGVGFVLTTNDAGEHLMMGREGMRRLQADVVEGVDPVRSFVSNRGDEALVLRALTELCGYPHAGDLIVNGRMLSSGIVVSFEEHRGTHGGLGGEQNEAFVIFPRRFRDTKRPLHSPAQMHDFLAALLAQ